MRGGDATLALVACAPVLQLTLLTTVVDALAALANLEGCAQHILAVLAVLNRTTVFARRDPLCSSGGGQLEDSACGAAAAPRRRKVGVHGTWHHIWLHLRCGALIREAGAGSKHGTVLVAKGIERRRLVRCWAEQGYHKLLFRAVV